MSDPRPALRGRKVLVIDEALSESPAWVSQLSRVYSVVTIASVAGASVAMEGQDVAAVVLVLSGGGEGRARQLVTALRRHRGLGRAAVFVISGETHMLAAQLVGISDVEIVDPVQAEYDLSLQVGAAASRMSSRPAPRRLSSMLPPSEFKASIIPPPSDNAQRMLVRFAQECSERGQRGLILCERLSSRDTSATDRQRAAEDLRSLLNFIRADALVLSQGPLAEVLGLAEQVLARLNPTRGQVIVPRGVVGLLASVVELGQGSDQLTRFDAELHRIRLESAIER